MIKGLIFDLNGTLIDICTSECDEQVYRTTANFLDYHKVKISPDELKKKYFDIIHAQKCGSDEEFSEFNVTALFSRIIKESGNDEVPGHLPETAAIVFRAAGRYRLELYDGVFSTLQKLAEDYPMAAVSDGQRLWALPELHSVGLDDFFPIKIISSSLGYRKPDRRMYEMALSRMGLLPHETIFVGNDMYRDIYGAKKCGMKTVFFRSNQGEQNSRGAEPDYIIYNFPELLNAVDFLKKKQTSR